MRGLVLMVLAAALAAGSAHAAAIARTGAPAAPIASTVSVPAGSDTLYVSGMTPPAPPPVAPGAPAASWGDTQAQTVAALKRIDETLKGQGFSLGDVVMMHVYLVGDPAKGGKMDFEGMMAGYKQFFGTAEQPNKPARTTVQVSALVNPNLLVEIEVIAAKAH